jgi:SAM-dependent methyltransferase
VPENYFVGSIASDYKAKWPHLFDPDVVGAAVDFLATRAGSGPVLELGLGTGRLALPLSRKGLSVYGIELSPDMVTQLQAEEGADAISVTMGDFSTTAVEGCRGTATLAYLVRNTITNLTTQDAQVACFANVAAHLAPGGVFVMEVMVPDLQRLPPGETVRPFTVTPTHVGFEEYDVAAQRSISHHYWMGDGTLETFSAPFRYLWPAELDLMARLAGLTLRERWNDWDQSPFTSESRNHISVWELPGPPEP